jgi:site-specific DNA-methyltransferase (adenine-specific)
MQGDCLELMKQIPDETVDMVLADPPYGTTACKWDSVIPFEPMWEQLKRVTKKNGAIVMTASQPFTSALVMSNVKMFKYCWVWDKVTARGHLVAKIRPMAQHEDIVVFASGKTTYNPQMTQKKKPERGRKFATSSTSIMPVQSKTGGEIVVRDKSYPKTIQTFSMDKRVGHPTQKPVALMEYLIKTYTNEGETVLDFTMGSGTTGVAAKNLNRSFIGIELDPGYFRIAKERIEAAYLL